MAGPLGEHGAPSSGIGLGGRGAGLGQQLQPCEGRVERRQLRHCPRVPGDSVARAPQLQPTALHQAPGEGCMLTLQPGEDFGGGEKPVSSIWL